MQPLIQNQFMGDLGRLYLVATKIPEHFNTRIRNISEYTEEITEYYYNNKILFMSSEIFFFIANNQMIS